MKKEPPSNEAMETFFRLQVILILTLSLALIIWEVQNFAASFAATEMTTSTTLRTVQERDDARVLRAIEQAKGAIQSKFVFETETNPQQQTRDTRLTFTGNTKREVLDARQTLTSAIQAAFAREGPGELFDMGFTPSAEPVKNHAYFVVKQTCQAIAVVIFLLGLVRVSWKWKGSGLPRTALYGILASAFTLLLYGLGEEGAPIWGVLVYVGPPLVVLGFVFVLMRRVRRASTWTEGRAKILKSKIVAAHHRFGGDTTKVRNLPEVEYEFDPGAGPIRNDRISLGSASANNVDETMRRYPVGALVPVFYDPRNPQDCVLERDPPASPGCVWGGTIFCVLVYEALVLFMWSGVSINSWVNRAFPQIHHALAVFITGLLGLFCLIVGIWNMLHPRKAFPWTKTKGTIVSSATESFRETDDGPRRMNFRPVIEFTYEVEGHEYRGSNSSTITFSGGEAAADEEVARYPVGMEVDVHYNPKKPTQSGLNVDTEMVLHGRRSLVVAAVLITVAIYLALH